MNNGVTYHFSYGTLWIIWQLFPILSFFPPSSVRVISYKSNCILQLTDDTTFQFCIIQCLTQTTRHVKFIPTCAEDTRMAYRRIVCQQCPSIGQFSVIVYYSP